MKKLYQLLNKKEPIAGDVGIEIECEGKNLKEVFEGGWKSENDGSLRGRYPESAIEYVLDKPIKVGDVHKKVSFLAEQLEGAKLDFSFRTSVHVHVNVQDLTEAEVCNMAYIYLLLEEPLTNFCGRDRKGNRFCLRVVDAEHVVSVIRTMCEKGVKTALQFDENAIRYGAINLASMCKYGSIEFRAMRGNMDADTINIWANSLIAIRRYAQQHKSPQSVREEFEKIGPAKFIKKVLGDYAVYFDYPRVVKEMQRSYSLTIEIPYSYKEVVEEDKPVDDVLQYYRNKYGMPKIKEVRLNPDNKDVVQIYLENRWIDWALAEAGDRAKLEPANFKAAIRRPARIRVEDF